MRLLRALDQRRSVRVCVAALLLAGTTAAQDATRLERDVSKLASFGTRHTASATESDTRGIGAARRWIHAELEAIAKTARPGAMTVHRQRFAAAGNARVAKGVEIENVYAVLNGTDPIAARRFYVVSGHYDSRASDPGDATSDAPGANDDASGTAVVLELARLFARGPTEASLVFLCVAGEEQGLLGSRHFAKEARAREWRIEGMFTNDIVGNTLGPDGKRHGHYVRVFSEGMPAAELTSPMGARLRRAIGAESDSPSRQLARFVHEHAKGLEVKLVFRPDRFLRGGDHLAFNEAGYPAVRFTEPYENFKREHQDVREGYGDLADHVDYAYVARVCEVNRAALAALAHAPATPKQPRIHAKQLENTTTLSWNANEEADLSHYEVVWRDTTAALWEHRRRVEGTEVTLDLSKDDWHFGVRAVDEDGNRSPVAYPRP